MAQPCSVANSTKSSTPRDAEDFMAVYDKPLNHQFISIYIYIYRCIYHYTILYLHKILSNPYCWWLNPHPDHFPSVVGGPCPAHCSRSPRRRRRRRRCPGTGPAWWWRRPRRRHRGHWRWPQRSPRDGGCCGVATWVSCEHKGRNETEKIIYKVGPPR